MNAFSVDWTSIYFYGFPPFSVISRCLQKVLRDRAECILVVPLWTAQTCYTELMILFFDRLSSDAAEIREPADVREFRQETSLDTQTATDSLSAIRRSFKDRNISLKATNILLASWRKGTQKQYLTYVRKWFSFCREKQIDSIQANISSILEFFTELYESGCGYSAINTARCALSAIGIVKEGFAIGAHPLIVRFMKGIFNLRPTNSRYCEIWDVSKVLLYLQKLSPVSKLSLKLLTYKLAMLIALTLGAEIHKYYKECDWSKKWAEGLQKILT